MSLCLCSCKHDIKRKTRAVATERDGQGGGQQAERDARIRHSR